MRKQDIEMSKLFGMLRDSYLMINLNRICETVLGGKGKEELKVEVELDENTLKVYELISKGNLNSLEIKFKDGKIQSLKKVIKANPSVDLEGILKGIQFGELTIKKQNGKKRA